MSASWNNLKLSYKYLSSQVKILSITSRSERVYKSFIVKYPALCIDLHISAKNCVTVLPYKCLQ